MAGVDLIIQMLLIIGGVEVNPGPHGSSSSPSKLDLILGQLAKLEVLPSQVSAVAAKIDSIVDRLENTEKRTKDIEEENKVLRKKVDSLEEKLDYIENQSRRNNLVVRGIPEEGRGRESWDQCRLLVVQYLDTEMGIKIEESDIERAHRIPGRNKPRAIVVKFINYNVRERVFAAKRNIKTPSFSISEDFSKRIQEERRHLIVEMKAARQQEMKATITYNKLRINDEVYMFDRKTQKVVKAGSFDNKGVENMPEVTSDSESVKEPIQKNTVQGNSTKTYGLRKKVQQKRTQNTIAHCFRRSLSADAGDGKKISNK